jgi:hypothetical protein
MHITGNQTLTGFGALLGLRNTAARFTPHCAAPGYGVIKGQLLSEFHARASGARLHDIYRTASCLAVTAAESLNHKNQGSDNNSQIII